MLKSFIHLFEKIRNYLLLNPFFLILGSIFLILIHYIYFLRSQVSKLEAEIVRLTQLIELLQRDIVILKDQINELILVKNSTVTDTIASTAGSSNSFSLSVEKILLIITLLGVIFYAHQALIYSLQLLAAQNTQHSNLINTKFSQLFELINYLNESESSSSTSENSNHSVANAKKISILVKFITENFGQLDSETQKEIFKQITKYHVDDMNTYSFIYEFIINSGIFSAFFPF